MPYRLMTTSVFALAASLAGAPGFAQSQNAAPQATGNAAPQAQQECSPGGGFPCSYEGTRFNSPDEMATAGVLNIQEAQLYSMANAANADQADDAAAQIEPAGAETEAQNVRPPLSTDTTTPGRTDALTDEGPARDALSESADAVPPAQEPAAQAGSAADAEAEAQVPAAPERAPEAAEAELPEAAPQEDVQAEVDTDAGAAAEAAAEAQREQQAEAEAQVDAEAEAEAQADAQVEAAPEAEQADGAAQTAAPAAQEATADEAATGNGSTPEARPEVTRIDEETPARTSTPPVDVQALEQGAESEVTQEQLTEEDVRSSDEEFDTSVSAAPAPQASDDDGLSNLEKALLFGLGAFAVGEILDSGEEVVSNTGDRVVVRRGDELRVLKSDNALLRRPGADVRTESFSDGSTRTTVTRADGTQVVTISAPDGRVIRRVRILRDGRQVTLVDETVAQQPVDTSRMQFRAPQDSITATDVERLREELAAQNRIDLGRNFTLEQVRSIEAVRDQVAPIELSNITFPTGSAAIQPSQAEQLSALGRAMSGLIDRAPGAVFLVEGHTDAVGDARYNLALSDRRAETVALALTEYFDVPPENLIVQGYGESDLKVPTLEAERANRRAVVRNITPLLR